jgi:hypothetical protein
MVEMVQETALIVEYYGCEPSSINEQRSHLCPRFALEQRRVSSVLGNSSSSLHVPHFLPIRHTTAPSSLAGRDVSGVNEVRSNM